MECRNDKNRATEKRNNEKSFSEPNNVPVAGELSDADFQALFYQQNSARTCS
jgi:hypothetical protein